SAGSRPRALRPAARECPRGTAAAARSGSGPWAGSRQWLQETGEVEGGGGVRERTHRHEVYAGARDLPDGLERHATARLELRPTVDTGDDLAQQGGRHVVQEEPRRARRERLVDLGDRPALDLERDVRRGVTRGPDRRGHPACHRGVVLLDEDRVVEPGAVVRPAAGGDRGLLE